MTTILSLFLFCIHSKSWRKRKMKFVVVEFEDNDIAVVPEIWLDEIEKSCRWPKLRTTDKVTAAVNRALTPQESWDSFPFVRIFGRYDTVLEARSNAKIFEVQSDAGTDSGKRKRKDTKKAQVSALPPAKASKKTKLVQQFEDNSSGNSESDNDSIPSLPEEIIEVNEDHGSDDATSSSTAFSIKSSSLGLMRTPQSQTSRPVDTVTPTSRANRSRRNTQLEDHDLLSNAGFQEEVISSLSLIKIQLRDLVAAQTTLQKQLNAATKLPSKPKNIFLPLETVVDLDDLETKVSSDESYNTELANLLDNIGGRDVRYCTFATMRKLMSNYVATRLNWKGRNAKIPFEKSTVCDIVTNCVMYQFDKREGTFLEVKKAIQDWLKAAKQRMKHSATAQDQE